jgi:hypothetical protein
LAYLIRLSLLCLIVFSLRAQDTSPRLLLTARRLHRLKLDRERNTARWSNFEHRVKTVPDSPQRGFELALYGIVASDAPSCHAAIQWGLKHKSEYRQTALIADWCQAQISESDRVALLADPPAFQANRPFTSARNVLFSQVARGEGSRDSAKEQWAQLLPLIQRDPRVCLPEAYALYEFLDAANTNFRIDLRQDDPRLFSNFPLLLLLSLHPAEVEQPQWKQRMGGLMMVNVDPNLQASSFVQGWALEDPRMVLDGPGIAYEFLWANPYLPGLGYYNMDHWFYDPDSGLLLARKSWDANSCWVSIFHGKVDTLQCAGDILNAPTKFGKLTLMPMKEQCEQVTVQPGEAVILSRLNPGRKLAWETNGEKFKAHADASGLALVSMSGTGRVCQVK